MLEKKKTKFLIIAGTAGMSLALALIAGSVLHYSQVYQVQLRTLVTALAILSPVPLLLSVFLLRAVSRYADDARRFATRDPLTGLYNQNAFWDLLQYETQRSRRQEYKFSLLLIDLDNFKIINDKYGHEVGDAYLREFSTILKAAVRKGDIPARYAGDNFTAILPVCDEEQAYIVAKRILESMRGYSLPLPGGAQVQETVSIGVAVFPNHAQDAQDLFLVADSMLGHAKDAGKDHMSFPSETDNIEEIRNLGEKNILVLEALRRKDKKIVPYFQPIVDVNDRGIMAYEVLTRIVENGRVVPAADFIEAAENMGAIGKIDYQLIEQTFLQVKEKKYAGTLFLNLSPKALVIADFIPTMRALFHDFDIHPANMVFEITERDTVKNVRLIEAFVRSLRDEGFRFAIDDFGAGYSSFHYLRMFTVDYLKVDGVFIRNMRGSGAVEREIVTSIAGLANRLRIKTIAEYVETEAILGEVASAGIHYAQGYYIKRPSPDLE